MKRLSVANSYLELAHLNFFDLEELLKNQLVPYNGDFRAILFILSFT
jgi:hypothetical protein